MKLRDALGLLMLSALWGASFLFMRIATPEFGPVVLAELRIAIGFLVLLPILMLRGQWGEMARNWRKMSGAGLLNTAIPFMLFPFSTLYLTGGFTAILNATAPIFTVLVAWIWLSAKLDAGRMIGFIIGIAGVIVLVWNKVEFGLSGDMLAIVAAVIASAFYGLGGNYTKKYLHNVSPLAIATGNQLAAAIVLLPVAVVLWPDGPISLRAWIAVISMGIFSTGIAYILYFRLIANVGPASAITVTYLTPVFAVLWGALFINEKITTSMIVGGAIILTGTALATGLLPIKRDKT